MPWERWRSSAPEIVRRLLAELPADANTPSTATSPFIAAPVVEPGAVLKGPLILGEGSLRGRGRLPARRQLDRRALQHRSGHRTQVFLRLRGHGARALQLRRRFDRSARASTWRPAASSATTATSAPPRQILVRSGEGGALQPAGCEKFGALIGDGARIGANAVVAPGALLRIRPCRRPRVAARPGGRAMSRALLAECLRPSPFDRGPKAARPRRYSSAFETYRPRPPDHQNAQKASRSFSMTTPIPATLIPGDGIGPEIVDATLAALDALKAPFDWDTPDRRPGPACKASGDPLPARPRWTASAARAWP
jgi:hypothetical protein